MSRSACARMVALRLVVPGVGPWTVETLRLYEATFATPIETVRLRIGFCGIAIADGILTVSGPPDPVPGRHPA